jgi:hypothetical protein
MNNHQLPESYVTEDGQHVHGPTYLLLADCHMVMRSAETGLTGPTLVEEGQVITTEMTPNHQMQPLNKAAGERFEMWINSLPVVGKGLSQEEISEAAFAMRPREGEPEIPHDQWWGAVMKYAVAIKEKRAGARPVGPAVGYRPAPSSLPIMPNAAVSGMALPPDPSRPPPQGVADHIPSQRAQAERQRRQAVRPPMPGTNPAQGPQAG